MTRDIRKTRHSGQSRISFHLQQTGIEIFNESRGSIILHTPISETILRTSQETMFFCSGNSHIQQAALFLQFPHRIDAHRRGEDILFKSDNENRRKLQSFGSMNGHQRHLGLFLVIVAVQIGQQRDFLQEVTETGFVLPVFLFARFHKILHTTQEFFQILLSRQVFRIRRTINILADTAFHDNRVS